MLLLLSGGAVGAFLAQDLLLFFLFYELEIVPLYFLIAIWGGARRGYAAMKFLLYTALSGILVLASFLGLVWLTEVSNFDYLPLRSHNLPLATQLLLLAPLLIGIFIKIPIFPFHTWATRCSRPGVYTYICPAGGGTAQARHLCPTALCRRLVPRRLGLSRALAGYFSRYQCFVWCFLCDRPKRYEEGGGIFLRLPHGLYSASRERHNSPEHERGGVSDGQPWFNFSISLFTCGHGLRKNWFARCRLLERAYSIQKKGCPLRED